MAASLIAKARENGVKEFVVGIEDIMPERMREYLLRVINTNRYTSSQFRFSQILEDLITKEGLYRILQEQLVDMEMDGELCFQKIELIEMMSGESGLEMEARKNWSLSFEEYVLFPVHQKLEVGYQDAKNENGYYSG